MVQGPGYMYRVQGTGRLTVVGLEPKTRERAERRVGARRGEESPNVGQRHPKTGERAQRSHEERSYGRGL